MATIKAIEAKSVHQIQSGQVIVDLCSVVKELVENSLDAGASNIEVSFKNNGLDLIEVRDNGPGISSSNYSSVALKHFTSKLSSYDDLSSLDTFGFRGEALSSLCALSMFSIVTAKAEEVPKGSRLEFEASGALKGTSTVAAQKGTIASVENLFAKLPVRQKELSKNIKREYGKVLSLLHAYACIGVNVKFTIKNAMPKAKSMVVFSTRGNPTTRDNIANVYGAKTLAALVPLDLDLDFQPTLTQTSRDDAHIAKVAVHGHISRPVFGEGRQTPDRQMFFVNGRPCGLPQIAKAINEVYRSFNSSQSPFIFADFRMDTNAYDVNVSPDKRTILLHNAANLIERLKTCLNEMFDTQEQTVPHSQVYRPRLPAFKHLNVQREESTDTASSEQSQKDSSPVRPAILRTEGEHLDDGAGEDVGMNEILHNHFRNQASTREEEDVPLKARSEEELQRAREKQAEKIVAALARHGELANGVDEYDDVMEAREQENDAGRQPDSPHAIRVRDFNARIAEQQQPQPAQIEHVVTESPSAAARHVKEPNEPGIVQNAFDRMRPKRTQAQLAIVTIDDESTTHMIGTQFPSFGNGMGKKVEGGRPSVNGKESAVSRFSQSLRRFGGPGTQAATDREEQTTDDDLHEEVTESRRSSTSEVAEVAAREHDAEHQRLEDESNPLENDRARSEDSDGDYVDEPDKKAEEEARVAELIRAAEESASMPSKGNVRRANKALKGGQTRDSATSLLATLDTSLEQLQTRMEALGNAMKDCAEGTTREEEDDRSATSKDEETRLSLTVSKDDFASIEITGQFNLGFILAVRRASSFHDTTIPHNRDELFIIDQHASDEKFNFERLQAETVVGNQRMVQPATLSLTAVEEEIVLENTAALEKNGFIVDIDTSSAAPVGRRVTLTSLPLSREVTFDTRDLDELIHLLSESPMLNDDSPVPRPGRVRKMFAMRACRSSVMIGKTLSMKQMERVVRNMGTMEKPWNCPHGRPTMRHLTSLDALPSWEEGDGVAIGDSEDYGHGTRGEKPGRLWRQYLAD